MRVTRISPLTGKENTLDLDITQAQIDKWQNGGLIQQVFPKLSVDEREFLITGTMPGEWEALLGPEE